MVDNLVAQRALLEAEKKEISSNLAKQRQEMIKDIGGTRSSIADLRAGKVTPAQLGYENRSVGYAINRLEQRVQDRARFISNFSERAQSNLNRVNQRLEAVRRAETTGLSYTQARKEVNQAVFRKEVGQLRGMDKERFLQQRSEVRAATTLSKSRLGFTVSPEQVSQAKRVVRSRERRIAEQYSRGELAVGSVSSKEMSRIKRFEQGRKNIIAVKERREARSLSSNNMTPLDANFSTLSGNAERQPPPKGETRPLASFGKPSAPTPVYPYAAIEDRALALQEREQKFFGSEGFDNIRKTARFATFGNTDVNFESRSFIGKTAELTVFGLLSAPIAMGGLVPAAIEKINIEAAARNSGFGGSVQSAKIDALKNVEETSYSFLPGGTPINPEGASTLAFAGGGALLSTAAVRSRPLSVSGKPKGGKINVEVFSEQSGRTVGETVKPPTAPRVQSRVSYVEDVTGIQRITRGKTAETKITTSPEGVITKDVVVGRSRFLTEQKPGASKAVFSEFKDGVLVRSRSVKPLDGKGATINVLELSSDEARSTVQLRDNVVAQNRQTGRFLQVEADVGGLKAVGVVRQRASGRSLSVAGESTGRASSTSLEMTFPKGSEVLGDFEGSVRYAPTRLRVGSPKQLGRQEGLLSRNVLDVSDKVTVSEKGITTGADVNRVIVARGPVSTGFEYASVASGELLLKSRVARVTDSLRGLRNKYDDVMSRDVLTREKAFKRVVDDFEVSRSQKLSRSLVDEPVAKSSKSSKVVDLGIDDARGGQVSVLKPPKGRTTTARQGDFFVEELNFGSGEMRLPRIGSSSRGRGRLVPVSFSLVSGGGFTGVLPSTVPAVGFVSAPVVIPGVGQPSKPVQRITPNQIVTPDVVVPTVPIPRTYTPSPPPPDDDYWFEDPVPPPPPPPGLGGFILPFGGGGFGGRRFGALGRTKFNNRYSSSIVGGLFNVKGSKRAANIASVTGLGVRPSRVV